MKNAYVKAIKAIDGGEIAAVPLLSHIYLTANCTFSPSVVGLEGLTRPSISEDWSCGK